MPFPAHPADRPPPLPPQPQAVLRRLRAGLFGALALAMLSCPHAAAGPAAASQPAHHIAPGDLASALQQFAGTAGILLSVDGDLVRGKHSPGLHTGADMPVDDALRRLLAGSGLAAVTLADGSYLLRPADIAAMATPPQATPSPPPPLQQLPAVAIEADTTSDYRRAASDSANRRATPLADTPQAVSVITAQLIADQAMASIADALRYVPGVGAAAGEGNRDTAIFRGNSSTADFYLDGLRDDVQYFRDFYNIDSMEVLKGPNALAFGHGGAGGVVNRVSKRPQWRDQGSATLSLGSWRAHRTSVDLDGLASAGAAWRLNAMAESSGAFRDGVSLRRAGINPVLDLRLTPRTTALVSYEHFRDSRTTDRGVPSSGARPLATPPGAFFGNQEVSDSLARLDTLGLVLEHDLGAGATLRNRSRYGHYDKFYQNLFPTGVNAAATQVSLYAYNSATRRDNLFNQTDLLWTAHAGGLEHALGAGLEFGRETTDNLRNTGYFTTLGPNVSGVSVPLAQPRSDLPLTFRPSATDADNRSTARSASAYLQDQLRLSPRWLLLLGLRYEYLDIALRDHRGGGRAAATDRPLSPRAGLVYQPLPVLSLYASYSETTLPRAGDQLSSLTAANSALAAERFRNVELGAKWTPRPGLDATLAAYRLTRGNVAVADPTDSTRTDLVDGQRSQGIELGLAGDVSASWHVAAAYAWQDALVTASQAANIGASARVAMVPRHTLALWQRYDLNHEWGAALGLVARGAMYASASNAVSLPGFARLDGALFWQGDRVKLQLNVENLLDRRYYASAHNDNNILPGSPRAVRLTLGSQF